MASDRPTAWTAVRVGIGLMLAASGFEKLIGPYQNFAFVIEQYRAVGPEQAVWIARTLPWAELIGGAFLALGLWTSAAAAAVLGMFGIFLGAVGQALWRRLPMDECGCFGELISLPLPAVFAMDLVLTALLIAGLARRPGIQSFGVDALYER